MSIRLAPDEARQLTRKPRMLTEIGGVVVSRARYHELIVHAHVVDFPSTLGSLDAVIKKRQADFPDAFVFIAVSRGSQIERKYLVDTQGYDYARYVAEIGIRPELNS